MVKNKILKCVLASVFALVLALSAFGVYRAFADGTEPSPTFEMENAAAARLSTKSGLRFRVKMDAATKTRIEADEAEYGFLVFPSAYLEGVTGDYKTALRASVDIAGDKAKIYEENGAYYANACLIDILEQNVALSFSAIAYINEGGAYTYAAFDRAFSRSIYDVLSKASIYEPEALPQIKTAYPWLGTAEYPVTLGGAEDYTALSDAVAGGESYTDVNFSVTKDFNLEKGFTSIGAGFAGQIDGGNKTVKTETDGEVAVFAANGDAVKNLNFACVTDKVIEVNETNAKRIFNNDIASSYVAAADMDFTGDYTGNAVRFRIDNNGGYSVSFSLGAMEIPEHATHVEMWIATDKTAGTIYMYDGLTQYAQAGDHYTLSSSGVWEKVLIPINDFKNFASDKTKVQLFRIYKEGISAGANVYVGDIKFIDRSNYALEMNAATASVICNEYGQYAVKGTYVANADLPVNEGYSGGASKVSGLHTLYITLNYSADELTELKSRYGKVIFNVMYVSESGKYIQINGGMLKTANGGTNFLFSSSGKPQSTWHTFEVSIDDVIAAMQAFTAHENSFMLLKSYTENPYETFYIGDVILSE